MTNRQITVPIAGATAWECGECKYRKLQRRRGNVSMVCKEFTDMERGRASTRLIYNRDTGGFLRCPACLTAETGIEGYGRGEEGRQCRDCWHHDNPGEDGSAVCELAEPPFISLEGACPRWEKG